MLCSWLPPLFSGAREYLATVPARMMSGWQGKRMGLAVPYLEAILVWEDSSHSVATRRWLEAHGLGAHEMRAGLLVTGSREAFERVFGVDLSAAEPPVDLPVPPELRGFVAAIRVPEPRRPRGAVTPASLENESSLQNE